MTGGMKLDLLGVHGRNAQTIEAQSVEASDFLIGGLVARFERAFTKVFDLSDPKVATEIFGEHSVSSFFGFDMVKTFFDNIGDADATLLMKGHVGNNGASIDAVVSEKIFKDMAGLASAITLANSLKTTMNAHAADAAEHTGADTTSFPIVSDDAMDLESLLTLVNELTTAYTTHDNDVLLASPAFHQATTTANALTATATITSLVGSVTQLNDLKAKYNLHDANATSHTVSAQHVEAAANASSTPVDTLKVQAAYKKALDYGQAGDRTGIEIKHVTRLEPKLAATVAAAALEATLDSVIGVKKGDIIVFRATGAPGAIVEKKVLTVDEGTNKITWAGAFHGSATGAIGDAVKVPGFTVTTWRKNSKGIVQASNILLRDDIMTMEAEVVEFYSPTVQEENTFAFLSDLASGSSLLESFPDATDGIVFLENGSDGTAPTSSSQWDFDLNAFAGKNQRFIINPETSDIAIMKAQETKMANREDTPISIPTLAIDQTKNQLQIIGASYQKSDESFQVPVADWLTIDDPFNLAPTAPDRKVPNVGAVMGAWIRSINDLGVHQIPATSATTLRGVTGVVNENLGQLDDRGRTDLAEFGINIIQTVPGSGIRIRNFFTSSTKKAERFSNGILMRNFIKISSADSLSDSENTPGSLNRITEDRTAI
ncbi:hypothetical protein KAR91_68790, partial [Candidatus Pacearchaeota archaeon]|nr:hypothetical protein [Candidatus Pacearchaeota archaeon]